MAATRRTVYVASTGDDTSGQGTQTRPFRTIERARSLIRQQGWNVGMAANQVVSIAPGTYWDVGTATLTEADSGSNGFYVVYECSGGPGEAILNGGVVINPASWVNVSGSIYKAPLSGKVYTMWENGVRGRAARTPKLDPGVGFPCSFAPYYTSTGVASSASVLQYDPLDFDPSPWALEDVGILAWSQIIGANIAWFSDTHPATALDTGTHRITLANNGLKFSAYAATGSRYFMQGPLELLTEAGEFVCAGGFLYYWARDGAIASQEIVVPTATDVIRMAGNAVGSRVSYVHFDGLALNYTDFDSWYRFGEVQALISPSDDYAAQRQNPNVRHGLVYMENTDHCKVTRCHGKNSGFAGLYKYGAGQHNTIQGCWFEHAGSSTVYIEGPTPGGDDIMTANTYWDLKLNNFGELAGDGEGIHVNQSSTNVLRYMLIENGPRYGMELTGWNSGTYTTGFWTTANDVSYIKILNVGQDSGDLGALTCNFFNRTGVNYFDQIIVDGVNAQSSVLDVPPVGFFTDNETNGQHLSNIQVTNTQGAQFRINDSGGHVYTNCSFLPDGSANPSFNAALMDAANIGLTADFPF